MRLYIVVILFVVCIAVYRAGAQNTCGMGPCAPMGEPDISDCRGGLDRYLSRAISMKGLVLYNAEVPWDDPCNDPAFACAQPLTRCPNGYCPARYCEDISVAVNMKAALLMDVTSTWGDEWKLVPGTNWYKAAAGCVQDINRAYDCAGLQRPIIGAAVLEWVSKMIEEQAIPEKVIAAFAGDPDFKASEFAANVHYDIRKIERAERPGTPDIGKLQTRMWVYQCAATYIDMGYKQIGLDVVGWSIVNGFDSARAKSYGLLHKIRAYAKSKGTFVLLSSSARDDGFFYKGEMMFDFRVAPLRPMEVGKRIDTLCTGPNNAVLDARVGETYTQTSGGISPMGCLYDRIPSVVVFDNHAGVCGTPGMADKLDYCIYGYDESTWFNALSEQCQRDWLRYAIVRAREISERGYVAMPGKLYIGPKPSMYRLYDHPVVYNAIKDEFWKVDTSLNWEYSWKTGKAIGSCGGGRVQYSTRYTFKVTAPELSSVTTWEIQKPDSTWEAVSYGASREYSPKTPGYYTIVMRADNWALATRGTPGEVRKTIYLERTYCRNVLRTVIGLFGGGK